MHVNAPVILQWPWENGIPLAHGSMKSYLKDSLTNMRYEGDIANLVGF